MERSREQNEEEKPKIKTYHQLFAAFEEKRTELLLLTEFVFYSVQVGKNRQRSSISTVKLLGVENVQIMQQKPGSRPPCWISCSAALPLVVGRLETHRGCKS